MTTPAIDGYSTGDIREDHNGLAILTPYGWWELSDDNAADLAERLEFMATRRLEDCGVCVTTFTDRQDGFTETMLSVDYYPGKEPMTVALSPERLRHVIPLLQKELDMIEGDNQ